MNPIPNGSISFLHEEFGMSVRVTIEVTNTFNDTPSWWVLSHLHGLSQRVEKTVMKSLTDAKNAAQSEAGQREKTEEGA